MYNGKSKLSLNLSIFKAIPPHTRPCKITLWQMTTTLLLFLLMFLYDCNSGLKKNSFVFKCILGSDFLSQLAWAQILHVTLSIFFSLSIVFKFKDKSVCYYAFLLYQGSKKLLGWLSYLGCESILMGIPTEGMLQRARQHTHKMAFTKSLPHDLFGFRKVLWAYFCFFLLLENGTHFSIILFSTTLPRI